MMKRPLLITLFLIYSVILFAASYMMGASNWPLSQLGLASSRVPPEAEKVFDPFWEVWNLVNSQYFDQPLEAENLMEGAIEGMLARLDDPNTRYLEPAVEESARDSMEGEIQGIGVLVEMVDEQITVVSPFEGSPAERAGIRPGDVLLEADGVDLVGMDLSEAAALIRGPAGTEVQLVILRDEETIDLSVTRDVVEIPSVRGEMLEGSVAYVRLSRFGIRTPEELSAVLEDLLSQDPRGMILDLRNNPGGGLDSSVEIADAFLEEGVVLVEEFGTGRERVFRSSDSGMAEDIPLVVLINEGSASASEVLAGAIRDQERGVLVGSTTFGKGTVQTWHALSNGGGVRITTARWITPDGDWINETGIMPDVVVPSPESPPADLADDAQLQAAIEQLQEMIGATAAQSTEVE
ncbi:MAG: S41 family peptidase [Chloroflexota bacterium]